MRFNQFGPGTGCSEESHPQNARPNRPRIPRPERPVTLPARRLAWTRSQIEDESEGLIDGMDLADPGHSSSGDDAFRGDDPNLVAACV